MHKLMNTRFLYQLFTSGFETKEHLLVRRLILLNAFLIIGIFTFVTFALLNAFVSRNLPVTLLDTVAAALLLGSFIDLRRSQNIKRVVFISTLTLSLFMIFFVAVNQNKNFGMIWTIFVPIFVISLYGHTKGLIISALYYLIIFTLAYQGLNNWEYTSWDTVALTRFVIASCVLVFVVFITEYAFDKLQTELNELSITDALTQLFNRRKIDEIISEEVEKVKRYGTELSLVILDIDDFKQINDTYGHIVGDEVLKELSQLLRKGIRHVDSVGRWGGEEFVIVLPQTPQHEATKSMERLAETIRSHDFPVIDKLCCSFGICTVTHTDFEKRHLITCADDALYQAKNSGKDRVVSALL